ncbi:MAG TPA: ABC transporter ATP-binding protein [Chloroflexi bacterium]|nr:MAG: ABC transporter ATP-binding protein [Chloroflexota bacterium]HDD55539.1 ABC transporter ATP-binding protein [Chloroflexota bacterium]
MRRLLKYLKPFLVPIIISIVLLFIQANAELALPDYLSRIVNNGIQQNGVENAVAVAFRQETLDRLTLFIEPDDLDLVAASYQLLTPDDPRAAEYVEAFPLLEEEPIYVLQDGDADREEELNLILGKALLAYSGLQRLAEDPSAAALLAEGGDFDPSRIPPGMDIFEVLESLPSALRMGLTTRLEETFTSLGESMITQMAVGIVKEEYEALGMDAGQLQRDYILKTGGTMLLISILGGVTTIGVSYFASRTAAGAARDIRKDVFEKVESFTSAEFDKFSTASLITRSTNDVTQVQRVIFMFLRLVVYAPILGIGGVIRAVDKSASMWWLIAVAVVALLALIITIFMIAVPKFKLMQDLIDRLNLVTRENLSGMMVIRAFNKQDDESQRFDEANRDLTDTSLFVARVMVTMMPVMMLLMNALSLAIIWVGSHQVAEAAIQVGDMMAFMQYAMQIVMAFLMMSMLFIFLPRAAVSGDRIADVLETDIVIQDPEDPREFPEPFKGEIEFQDVSFRYPDAEDDVVRDVSFTASPGQTTAFIGSTGCGKSTVINLIPRFYDVTQGKILIDGIDVRDVRQSDLRDKIGFVPQKGTLFSGTIESNLLYADPEADADTLREALDIAQASEFVFDSEEGLASDISQGGTNVSGGQKQRLSIARALVKKPPIYIFDDSFSALDFKTDSALRREMKKRTGDSTVLIVTQRVATVKNADQIIVLDEGRVVGKGTHKELMGACKTYQEIASSQLSKEELV